MTTLMSSLGGVAPLLPIDRGGEAGMHLTILIKGSIQDREIAAKAAKETCGFLLYHFRTRATLRSKDWF
jgi:hypothetical protein